MGNYKIKVNIEIVESDEAISSGPEELETGVFEFTISPEAVTSIDACEQALLSTNYPALRSALAHHLETLSQKKKETASTAGIWEISKSPYRVDGEIGRFEFMSYTAVESPGNRSLNRVNILYGSLPGKRWYRTMGFKEIAYTHGSTIESYRKTSAWLNRIRHQETGGTPSRTMQDSSEREGIRVLNHLTQTSEAILKAQGVIDTTLPATVVTSANESAPAYLAPDAVSAVIEQCGKTELIRQQMQANPIPYEDPHHSLNISIFDTCTFCSQSFRHCCDVHLFRLTRIPT